MTVYDFKKTESDILQMWESEETYSKIKRRNHGKKKFYFLQGPPYTSGRLHLGQAWNHSLKDMVLRYKRMNGFDAWDRGGFDMHGLPTENKVQKKFDLHTKKDILDFGMEKFTKECISFSEEMAGYMNTDLWKMGIWMNHDQAYMPIHTSFIDGEWFLIKKAHEKNRLYKSNKVMTWCKSCETALSKHELEYKTVKDLSIFVKFKVEGKEDEYLIIWTTTPWTIPFNLAVMVNPELDYLRAEVVVDEKTGKKETWIVSSALSGVFINGVANKEFKVIEEFKGEKLLGLSYIHPFHEYIKEYEQLKSEHKNVHTVILSEEYVDTSAGTGLVHCAPGCGPEDYEVGKAHNIPAFNTIDDLGVFPDNTGRFSGMTAKKDDNLFIDILRELGSLIETNYVEHEYAHCWRCKNPVIFRLTDQWFFKVEDLKDKMLEFNKDIHWVPQEAKNAFNSWLKNLKDNSITRQRFWGSPVPIWICEDEKCNKYEVIGSVDELKSKAITAVPNDLHKPWIDSVKIKCSCGKEMSRTPDVLDVWIDAGTTSWNCLDYPRNKELFEKYFPADFIVEGKDQIRGWYNLLMVASILAFDKPAFKNVHMHGFITDVEGEKMSKSLGNIISPYELIDKYGVDTLRYYMSKTSAGEDISFSWDEVLLRHKNLMILWNIHNYLIDFSLTHKIILVDSPKLDSEEKYILSRLHSTLRDVTIAMDYYNMHLVPDMIESLFMNLSRTYIQLIRDKAVVGSEEEKKAVLYTLYHTLMGSLKMFSITAPFITEQIYQNLKKHKEFGLSEHDSIHEFDWPKYDESMINKSLEKDMLIAQEVMQAALSCRDKMGLGVRWPLAEAIIDSDDEETRMAVDDLNMLIKQQVNIKDVVCKKVDVELHVKPNAKVIGKDFGHQTAKIIGLINDNWKKLDLGKLLKSGPYTLEGYELTINHVIIEKIPPENYVMAEIRKGTLYLDKRITKELEIEGFVREIIRRVQQLRKDSNLNKRDVIELCISSDMDLTGYEDSIKDKVGAKELTFSFKDQKAEFSSEEKIKGKTFHIMFNKLKI